ncbi:MAG: NAD(P)/FAD-dependent oxidoreductase, partial [Acidimicrobiia bacterium]
MNDHYDVVVVGARVAGAATALHLARAGHRVAVVDRAGPPTDTTSTHALMRTGVLQLRRAGVLDRVVEAGTPPIQGVTLVFGPERISFPVVDECGVDAYYAPRRTVLDKILLEEAVAAGAEFHSDISVSGVSRNDIGRVNGIFARIPEGGGTRVSATFVVGADGTHSRIARSVEAAVLRQNRPTNAVVYGYFEGIEAPGYEFR